jgi:hypothetical protein
MLNSCSSTVSHSRSSIFSNSAEAPLASWLLILMQEPMVRSWPLTIYGMEQIDDYKGWLDRLAAG